MEQHLTVKWKKLAGEYEELFPANKVWCRREWKEHEIPGGKCNGLDIVIVGIELLDGEQQFFENGDIYVMNSNGKTVADYHFEILDDSRPATVVNK